MYGNHLARVLCPDASLGVAVGDYIHNILVSTGLIALGPTALRQLRYIDRFHLEDTDDLLEDEQEEDRERRGLRAMFRDHARREGVLPRPVAGLGPPLGENIASLSKVLGLDPIDQAVLQFLVTVQLDGRLAELTDTFKDVNVPLAAAIIAAAAHAPYGAVLSSLVSEGGLLQSGLVALDHRGRSTRFSSKLQLRQGLLDLLVTPALTRQQLLRRFLPAAGDGALRLSDYAHLEKAVAVAMELLAASLDRGAGGVNLLLHGPTGTGKSELARLLARELGAELLTAGGADPSGEPPSARERLASLLLGQRILANTRSLLLFDEMEDLFRPSFRKEDEVQSKRWFTEFLERNRVPVIWTTNDIRQMDRAYLRRFTFSIELGEVSSARRIQILTRCCEGEDAPSSHELSRIALRHRVSPGQIASSVNAARMIAGEGELRADRIAPFLAASERLARTADCPDAPAFDLDGYRLESINASEDLELLAARLSAWRPCLDPGIPICLYGAPGTGKSEFALYLAHRMGRDVVRRSGSDIMSKWVGETEQNTARAFRDAERRDALLLFDEADTFLRRREDAVRGYEVSQVNEFLQQMERFPGVVVCTTNRWEEIDRAASRRFVFKVEFRALRPAQAADHFRSIFGPLLGGLSREEEALVDEALETAVDLTPGDFAVVRRRVEALGMRPGVGELLELVRAESEARWGCRRVVGFGGT